MARLVLRFLSFAEAGKAVRTGHSGAAVSGYRPPFMPHGMEQSQSGAIQGEGGGEDAANNREKPGVRTSLREHSSNQ